MVNIRQLARAKLISERKRSSGNESEGGQAAIEGVPSVLGARREGDGDGGGAPRAEKRRKVAAAAKAPVPNLSLDDDDQVRPFIAGSVFYLTAPAFSVRVDVGTGIKIGVKFGVGIAIGFGERSCDCARR